MVPEIVKESFVLNVIQGMCPLSIVCYILVHLRLRKCKNFLLILIFVLKYARKTNAILSNIQLYG